MIGKYLLLAPVACAAAPAAAQDRGDDNAVTQAEDAFGFSVGRESIGIYSAGSARGFSPTAAGNVRIDGLYFDPQFQLSSIVADSTSIKVGLSAQGYPFIAPSGVADTSLRRPGTKRGASIILNGDGYGGLGGEVDFTLPVSSTLSLGGGATLGGTEYPDGTGNRDNSQGLIARWRPAKGIEIVPFWTLYNDIDDEAGTVYTSGGAYLPPLAEPRVFRGPNWANYRYTATNHGLVASVAPARDWLVRLGAFRSVLDNKTSYSNLLIGVQPDGQASGRLVIADPPTRNVALSGELRVTHSVAEGPRLHVFHLSARRRDTRREFGGSDEFDLGPMRIDEWVSAPRPNYVFGPISRDRVQQTTLGFAYDGRWKDRGEVSFSVSRADYRKATEQPGLPTAVGRDTPWLYNATAAVDVWRGVTVYAGYARGLEESGVAPTNAANRNQPLPAILTRQADAGVRVAVTKSLRGVIGVFDLRRPYFSFDTANRFTQVGSVRSRGVEFSLSGNLTPRLNIVAGGVMLDPKVEKDVAITRPVGARPTGLPDDIITVNLNWRTPFVEGLSLDGGFGHRGKAAATIDNAVFLEPRGAVSAGGRYRCKLLDQAATVRVLVSNLLDKRTLGLNGPGVYVINAPRSVSGYLTVDL